MKFLRLCKKIAAHKLCAVAVLFSTYHAHAHYSLPKYNNYISLRGSNNVSEMTTELFLSGVNLLDYGYNKAFISSKGGNVALNMLAEAGAVYGSFLFSVLNHEISGHAGRIWEFGGKVDDIKISFFDKSSVTYSHSSLYEPHLQKFATISLDGNEANYHLSQKLLSRVIKNGARLTPVISGAYIFSAANQSFYLYIAGVSLEDMDGHDMIDYAQDMSYLYGAGSMSLHSMKSAGYISLADPMLFASLWSIITNKEVDVPFLKIGGGIGVMPSLRMLPTPYGILEKYLVCHVSTPNNIIRLSFGGGVQNKQKLPFHTPSDGTQVLDVMNKMGIYAKETQQPIVQESSYKLDIAVDKLFCIGSTDVGINLQVWKQPEMFLEGEKNYHSQSKAGGLLLINTTTHLGGSFSIEGSFGYKTQGFTYGLPIKASALFSVGLGMGL